MQIKEHFLHAVKEKPFQKNFIFQKKFYKFTSGFPGLFECSDCPKTMLDGAAVFMKQFWKPISKT